MNLAELDSAARLVQVALEMLVEDAGALLDHGLRGEDVFHRARISQTTFYRKFNKATFIDAVMDALVPEHLESRRDLKAIVTDELIAQSGDPRKVLRKIATDDFRTMREDPATTRRLLALAVGQSRPKTARRLRTLYEAFDAASVEGYQALFETWGATLRAPLTVKHVAVALTAIVEGFAIRWRADNDAVPDWLFAEVILAFLASAIDEQQRHEHIDDVASKLAAAIMSSFQLSRSDDLPDNPREAVIEAAREEFSRRGYFLTTLEMIATTSGVPLPTVKRLFPTKPHVIVGALKRRFLSLEQSVHDDLTLGRGEVEVIERHLIRCAQLVADKPEFLDALIAAVAHDTYGVVESTIAIKQELNFPSLIAPVLEQGQRKKVFVSTQSPIEVAATMTNILFLRCFTRRTESPEDNARFVAELLLDGICVRA